MQMIRVGILLGLLVLFAVAQDAAPDAVQIWTAAALAQGEQALKTEAATDAHHTAVHHLADFPTDTFMLSHREPPEKRNGAIEGGIRYHLSAGDVVRIPARTPHQILLDGSKGFTYFVVKVK